MDICLSVMPSRSVHIVNNNEVILDGVKISLFHNLTKHLSPYL